MARTNTKSILSKKLVQRKKQTQSKKQNQSKKLVQRKKQTKSNRPKKILRSFFSRKLKGGSNFGPASWNESMINPYLNYSQNDYLNDSSNPPLGNLSARNINIGGSKRKSMNGGSHINATPLGMSSPISTGPGFSFGSTSGYPTANILIGSGLPLSSFPYDNNNFVSGIV